jgi:CheY-like chemotaxis protein
MTTPGDILIVDDDPDMVDVMELALGDEGYRCRHALNGRDALERLAEARPGLLLLDMLMPVMSGWELARAVRAAYGGQLPIVIVTAAEHAEARRRECGADEVLAKPFELSELLALAERYVPRGDRGAAAPHVTS